MRDLGPAPVLAVTMAMVTWGHGLRSTHEDEKAQTWQFLRVLPFSPRLLVTARFLSTATALLAYTVSATAAYVLTLTCIVGSGVSLRASLLGSVGGLAVGLALSSLFHAVYFRAGHRAAHAIISYVMLLVVLPLLSVTSPHGASGLATPLAGLGERFSAWTGAHPATAAALAAVAAAGLVIAGWAFSVAALTRREFR